MTNIQGLQRPRGLIRKVITANARLCVCVSIGLNTYYISNRYSTQYDAVHKETQH